MSARPVFILRLAMRSGVLAAASLLGACAVIRAPEVSLSAPATPQAWQVIQPARLDLQTDTGAANDAADNLAGWWQALHDPALNELLQAVLTNNPSMQSSGISYRLAELKAGVVNAGYGPKANAGISSSQSSPLGESGHSSSHSLSLSASWELDLWGARSAQRQQAQASVLRAGQEVRAAQVSLLAETVQAYISLRIAQANQQLAAQTIELRAQSHDLVRWEYQAGLKTELEQNQALTLLRQAEAVAPQHEQSRLLALQQLAALLGGESTEALKLLAAPGAVPEFQGPQSLRIPADVLRQRPDVLAQELAVQEQAQSVALARISRLPSFGLSGSIGTSSDLFADIFDVDAAVARLAGSLSALLFDGGVQRSNVKQSRLLLDQALLAYRSKLLTAQQEVEAALTQLETARRQQLSYQQALDAAEQAAELALFQYDAGLLDFSDLLTTQTALISARSSLLGNRSTILGSWIQLYRSLGGGWQNLPLPATAFAMGDTNE